MKNINIRRQIAREAARLLLRQEESDVAKARTRAAMRFAQGVASGKDLPGFSEIETQLQNLARASEPQFRRTRIPEMQRAALELMRLLSAFSPRLVGDPAFGFIFRGREIHIEITAPSCRDIQEVLERSGIGFVERKSAPPDNLARVSATTLSLHSRFPVLVTVLAPTVSVDEKVESNPTSGIGLDDLDVLLRNERWSERNVPRNAAVAKMPANPILKFRQLLSALEFVRQDAGSHPEGDALYHSLQVFELAWRAYPYDEEFLLAALLHDVGKAIDPRDHVKAGLRAIEDCTSPRTRWFVENLPSAKQWLTGSAGRRLRARLESHPDFDQLLELARMDRQGRKIGEPVRDLDSVLGELERLAREDN